MMSGDNRGWFWTPGRLAKLLAVLDTLALQDDEGPYFGPINLSRSVSDRGPLKGLHVDPAQVRDGLKILVFLGAIERGKSGNKNPDYKRRYTPSRIGVISDEDVNRFRRAHGVRRSLPPER